MRSRGVVTAALGTAVLMGPACGLGGVGGPYDHTREFGLSAMPAKPGESGKFTYIINHAGEIYRKDNGGKPVRTWPDVAEEGWVSISGG
jgi:hypothetical protein